MSTNLANTQQVGIFTKYKFLIVLIGAFFALILLLSSLTFVVSHRIAKATQELDLASQQTVLVQRLSKNLFDTNLYLNAAISPPQSTTNPNAKQYNTKQYNTKQYNTKQDNVSVEKVSITDLPQSAIFQLEEITEQYQLFDQTLQAFKQGGVVKGENGHETVITATTDPNQIKTLEAIQTIWTPYQGLLENFIKDNEAGKLSKNTAEYLMDYTRLYNLSLSNETNDYANYLNNNIQQQTAQLRMVQVVGMAIAFLLFLGIIFGALRQLFKSDKQLAAAHEELLIAQRQTDDIMNTVNEGLFLIDKDLRIADQYSGKLEEILQQKNIAGRCMYDLLKGMISQKDMDTTKLFIDQLYNSWVVEDLIQDLNPLKQVLVSYVNKKGITDTKFLEFNFLRVMDEVSKNVEKVFVSVVDVTNEVRLELQMQKDREQHDRQIEMISYLLTVNPTQLNNFIKETKQRIERMNNVLKMEQSDTLLHKAQQLYRESHSLKGDASAIKLNAVVDIVEKQESQVKQLLERRQLTGNDFLSFTIALNELMDMVNFIEELTLRLNLKDENVAAKPTDQATNQSAESKIALINPHKSDPISTKDNYWQDYFGNYANDIANRQGKKVVVSVNGFDNTSISEEKSHLYKDIATQFLKNAIVHGIESPSERLAKGKPELGVVTLSLENIADNQQKLSITDDGQGINWEKIRDKAVEIGQVTKEQAKNLQSKDLVRLMLSAGVSTADKQDEDAGRGVGMDIVRQLAMEGQGRFGMNSQPNQFTQMSVTFPR
ncbi:putative CheA signal transduction histidine kinase [Moraxella macacae 0408225]|uniref:Putative CheA signal transduction histidine kinase n=1 Tax=Moraxella macacae 0408225 TaxID=1230338 RepID=L2F8H9_9GAMM|nr:ATP-binding protein [Moraxella macacae]ELA09352.1 putative CheA signal transduction histidine kinase [Moraxella macacae 0408225]